MLLIMGILVNVAMMTSYHNTMMIYDCKQLINLQSLPPLVIVMKCRKACLDVTYLP